MAKAKLSRINGETLQEEMDRLRLENAALKDKLTSPNQITMKVSEKGALSVYGLGRFPVTLYQEQWLRLIDNMVSIGEFIEANQGSLKRKGE